MLQNLSVLQPSRAKIFKSIADPPTTTLQRLKVVTLFITIIVLVFSCPVGYTITNNQPPCEVSLFQGLTTGGLPTFIDVGHSFGAPAIVEDNFLHQVFIFNLLIRNVCASSICVY